MAIERSSAQSPIIPSRGRLRGQSAFELCCCPTAHRLRGQSALEQMLVVALAIGLIAIALLMAGNYSSDSLKISQAQDAVDRIVAASDYVYSLGPNSKDYVTVYLPIDLISISVIDKQLLIKLPTSGGTTDVFAISKAQLIGSLPKGRGKQKVLVQYLPNGKVSIGEAGLTCIPEYETRSASSGETFNNTVQLLNTADFTVTGVTATLTGAVSQLASITSPPPTSLGAGESANITIVYTIPEDQPTGVYGGYLAVESGDDGSCVTQFTISVSGETSCPALCVGQGYSEGSCRAAPATCVLEGEDYIAGNDYACSEPSPRCCCGPTVDLSGPIVSSMSVSPANASNMDNLTFFATCNDTLTGGSYISSAEGRVDGGALIPLSASGGAFNSSVVQNATLAYPPLPAGQHLLEVRCTDSANNQGAFYYHYFNVTMADTIGPIVTYLSHSDAFPTTLANITEVGIASEIYTGNSNIAMCFAKVDEGDWFNTTPNDGAFNAPTEGFTFNVGQLRAGMHTVYARCTDSLGNLGGSYNDTFGVSAADIMLVLDRSGSMADPVTNGVNNTVAYTGSGTFTKVKSVTINNTNGDLANVSVESRTSTSTCTVFYEVKVEDKVIASGSRKSTSYGTTTFSDIDISDFTAPFVVDIYIKKDISGSCTVYNRNFALLQQPTKMAAAQSSASMFVNISDNSSKMGLISYSTSASTVRTLAGMGSVANKTDLQNAINGLVASGSTCTECGLDYAVNELISERSRYPEAVRVIVLLTDGMSNYCSSGDADTTGGCVYNGASYARDSNVTVYTIGFGGDVNPSELTNVAYSTGGKYYFAPDVDTLIYIFQHIGQ